ncbi:MAG: ATP-dependent DNA ligase [Rhodospirillales bacterium]|nr:ATP-dependent DNA ligase [Rhodospirillales bacterium]
MKDFARLLAGLPHAPTDAAKTALLRDYFAQAGDPARGTGLGLLTGAIAPARVRPALLAGIAATRIDPVLFGLSRDFVGDLAETVALAWPEPPPHATAPTLPETVALLRDSAKTDLPATVAGLLDRLDVDGRLALLKSILGGMRAGVSARLVKSALAAHGRKDAGEIEEIWPGLAPPYASLFAWLDGSGPKPAVDAASSFRPMMRARPLDPADLVRMDPAAWRAQWAGEGQRVQLAAAGGRARLWTLDGDEIGPAHPAFATADFDAVLDGTLKGSLRVHDLLAANGEDLRALPFDARRRHLETWFGNGADPRFELAQPVPFADWADLKALRARDAAGLWLKRADGRYPDGEFLEWKRDPHRIDAVLVYAQRGKGARGAFYSEFTFACRQDDRFVPVARVSAEGSDAELKRLDKFVRDNTVDRHGPVRVVTPRLVCELEFAGVKRSARHKAGIVLHEAQIARVRWDRPADEAGRIERLQAMVEA